MLPEAEEPGWHLVIEGPGARALTEGRLLPVGDPIRLGRGGNERGGLARTRRLLGNARGRGSIAPLEGAAGVAPQSDRAIDVRLEIDLEGRRIESALDFRALDQTATGEALIFDPNPVRTSGRTDLRDGMPVDAYRVMAQLEELNGDGRLQGRRVAVSSLDPVRAREPNEVFSYSSFDPRFEEAMAYYHGARAIVRAEDRGFRGLFARPIELIVHATAFDNSWYSRLQRAVLLGDGGVDDAEDADVILHEMGHAIHDALVPGFGGGDTPAISEGFSDFWAASLTGDPCLAEWDATAIGGDCLRRVDEDAVYPTWIVGQAHHDGAIWSRLLWDLRGDLGEVDAERLALAGFLEQSTGSGFREAGEGLLRAATKLGLDADQVELRLSQRGLVPQHIRARLASGSERAVPLLEPVQALGVEARALRLTGDGIIHFVGPNGSELRFTPLGSSRAQDPRESVEFDFRFAPQSIAWRETWRRGEEVSHRVDGKWSREDGSLRWSYLELPDAMLETAEAGEWNLLLDASEVGEPAALDLRAVDQRPLRTSSFIADLGDAMPALLGARFGVASSGADYALWREVAPLRSNSPDRVLVAVSPNPAPGAADIRLRVQRQGPAAVALFDLAGRRVRRMFNGSIEAGVTWITWDGRDDQGRHLPPGIYFVRARTGDGDAGARITLLPR
ncbi:MAG: FlgD immunoglobulin-like domain containing protein [Candidatus Eisenbacteria bacterium]